MLSFISGKKSVREKVLLLPYLRVAWPDFFVPHWRKLEGSFSQHPSIPKGRKPINTTRQSQRRYVLQIVQGLLVFYLLITSLLFLVKNNAFSAALNFNSFFSTNSNQSLSLAAINKFVQSVQLFVALELILQSCNRIIKPHLMNKCFQWIFSRIPLFWTLAINNGT